MSQSDNDKPNTVKMKRLEDIEKKNIHSVPEGYFDDLPMRIQARVAEKSKSETPVFVGALRYALPALVLIAVAYVGIFRNIGPAEPADLLADVSTEDIISYLASSDITTEEILTEISLDDFSLDLEMEGEILNDIELGDEDLEGLYDQFDSEYL